MFFKVGGPTERERKSKKFVRVCEIEGVSERDRDPPNVSRGHSK